MQREYENKRGRFDSVAQWIRNFDNEFVTELDKIRGFVMTQIGQAKQNQEAETDKKL